MGVINTTSSLSQLMSTYYDKLFLEMAMPNLRHYQFGQKRTIPKNQGKTVNWSRYTRLAAATTSLTEAVNPCQTSLTASTISATVADYGAFTKSSSLVSMTAIDPELKTAVEILGKQADETLDTLVRNAVAVTGTAAFPNAHVQSTIVVSDVLTAAHVRRQVRELKKAFCPTFKDGTYAGVITTDQGYDLLSDSATGSFIDVNKYTTTEPAYKGELGKLYGCRMVETPIGFRSTTANATYSATGLVHYATFIGPDSVGVVNVEGAGEKIILVKKPNDGDTSNPLNMFTTVGWKRNFATKVLNVDWVKRMLTGATA